MDTENTRRTSGGMLALMTWLTEGETNEQGYLRFMPTDGSPLIWGIVNDAFARFRSKEEREMLAIIEASSLLPQRTRGEALWRLALAIGQRSEENDRALVKIAGAVESARASGLAHPSSGVPICLDPDPMGLQGFGINAAFLH